MLNGKNAVITGSNSGIGWAILEKFASNGANIWACARMPREAFERDIAELSVKYSVWIRPVYFDLSDKTQVAAGAKEILDQKLPIDILVNNAAINQIELFMQANLENIEKLFTIDFFNPMFLTQKLVKRMIRQKSGNIINILSARAFKPARGRLAYCSAKSALKLATEVLSLELAEAGIRVNAVAPGQINSTRMMNELKSNNTALMNVLGRFGTPEEIADSVLFLASDMSSYITGFTLQADGGEGYDFSGLHN